LPRYRACTGRLQQQLAHAGGQWAAGGYGAPSIAPTRVFTSAVAASKTAASKMGRRASSRGKKEDLLESLSSHFEKAELAEVLQTWKGLMENLAR
jgi:hypothetical protein